MRTPSTSFRCLLLVSLFALLAAAPAAAQELPFGLDIPLEGVTGYDASVPTPEEVIGHQIGTQHTRPHQVVEYFKAVAEASGRVQYAEHGRTYEGRRLIHAFVTAPENLSRLEEIRQANVRLSDDPGAVSDEALAGQPAVVLMGYSIHGNEASGTEAAILFLYHLAAGQGPAVEEALQNVVFIVDPMFNPDGRDRFADWANGNRGGVATTDPQDREHDEPWPGGRTNHYWFDLNRDWLPVQHPESQGRIDLFQRWRPQVLTDYHEMGGDATYFFQPGIPSRTNPNTPDRNQELTGEIAEYHAEILDEIGSLYYTRESFDDFYYGKGSTYPDINGSIGILFEQASSRALKTETDHGLLDYAFTVRNQLVASLSTMAAVRDLRTDLLRYQRDFFANAADLTGDFDVQGYVLGLDGQRTRAQLLAQVLQRHGVELYELQEDVEQDGQAFRPGAAYVVPVDQRQGRLVKAVMETTTTFPDSLFYDVSTWTLPLAYGLDYAEVADAGGLAGALVDSVALDGGEVVGGRSDYAYVMPWDAYYAPRALYRLQEAGVYPLLMTEPFVARVGSGQQQFDRGAIVVPVQARSASPDAPVADSVHAAVQRSAREDHVRFYAVASGLTPSGPDLGSRGAEVLEQPRIALLVGSGTSSYNTGEVWHLLTERFRIPISLVEASDVGRVDMSRYNTLVIAGGYGSIGGLDTDAVRAWVQQGGRLVTLDGATDWAVENEMLDLEARELDVDSLMQDVPYADLSSSYGAQQIGGTIFDMRVDPTHPLAYGYAEEVPVFRSGTTFYEPSDEPGTSVGVYADPARLSGYISDDRAEQAAGAAALVAQRVGGGHVIGFTNNPNFRAFWYGTNGLFLNALFLGGAL